MQLVTYRTDRGDRAGILREDTVIDAWDALGGGGESVRELLAAERVSDLEGAGGETLPLTSVELLAPVPDPEKIIGLGLNYRSHAEEAGQELPASPVIFGKWANALIGPDATVPIPAASEKVDFEAEVAFVVGRPAKDVSEADAMDHVAGYTLLNDLSARDLQFRGPQWMAGKVFDGSAPCGPALVTPDEAGAHDAIEFALDLNGERMQESSTADLIFSVPELLADLSTLMTLRPGDIVATGTPAGVGSTRKPRVWLKPGDEVVISSPTLGELRTLIG
jgi:2-keto-4-pentenoate hydratase/2-oxohepta-3-ene-1,7-dioic acid hydratase in catechol pathway